MLPFAPFHPRLLRLFVGDCQSKTHRRFGTHFFFMSEVVLIIFDVKTPCVWLTVRPAISRWAAPTSYTLCRPGQPVWCARFVRVQGFGRARGARRRCTNRPCIMPTRTECPNLIRSLIRPAIPLLKHCIVTRQIWLDLYVFRDSVVRVGRGHSGLGNI